jgi:hypothetical protein
VSTIDSEHAQRLLVASWSLAREAGVLEAHGATTRASGKLREADRAVAALPPEQRLDAGLDAFAHFSAALLRVRVGLRDFIPGAHSGKKRRHFQRVSTRGRKKSSPYSKRPFKKRFSEFGKPTIPRNMTSINRAYEILSV